jgi:hypothetical protein
MVVVGPILPIDGFGWFIKFASLTRSRVFFLSFVHGDVLIITVSLYIRNDKGLKLEKWTKDEGCLQICGVFVFLYVFHGVMKDF